MAYKIRSRFFQNDRLQKAANDHAYHLVRDSTGHHVALIQMFLVSCGAYRGLIERLGADYAEVASEFSGETATLKYGAVTEELVRRYKDLRDIKNVGGKIDGIVGILTMRAMDSHQEQLEANGSEFEDRAQAASLAPHKLKPIVMAGRHALRPS